MINKIAFNRIKDCMYNIYRNSEIFSHLLVGLPSYEKYLEYHQRVYPHSKPKSRKSFFLDSQNKKYGCNGNKRCC